MIFKFLPKTTVIIPANNSHTFSFFDQLHQSMKEAVAIAKGEMQPSRVFTVQPPDVKAVREKIGLSQAMFAAMIGVKVKALFRNQLEPSRSKELQEKMLATGLPI